MPKPTTKKELIGGAQKERAALEELLSTLTPEQMTQPKYDRGMGGQRCIGTSH